MFVSRFRFCGTAKGSAHRSVGREQSDSSGIFYGPTSSVLLSAQSLSSALRALYAPLFFVVHYALDMGLAFTQTSTRNLLCAGRSSSPARRYLR